MGPIADLVVSLVGGFGLVGFTIWYARDSRFAQAYWTGGAALVLFGIAVLVVYQSTISKDPGFWGTWPPPCNAQNHALGQC
jgi:hypothetical protein